MRHVSLDIETLGTHGNPVVLSIAAVVFDMETQTIGESLHVHLDLTDCLLLGMKIDPKTLMWWLAQSEEARRAVVSAFPRWPVKDALAQLSAFFTEHAGSHTKLRGVWGNGASFDNAIIANMFHAIGKPQPWHFRLDRCLRTLRALRSDIPAPEFEGTAHDALADATHQARHTMALLNAIGEHY